MTNCTKIINSTTFNPWYNLALEELLLDQVGENEVILYLWQNQNTVVIGRNQNAWKECRCQMLEKDGGKLARRLSGGGAVFHDLGNLNFTFVMDKRLYDLEKQLEVILQAVRSQGINAEFSGRNDLTVTGKKFSGNAFYHGSKSSYHHGTILVDVDFSKMSYLSVSKEKIQSKGVDSVKSRVVNLKELNPELTIDSIKKAMKVAFTEIYGKSTEEKVVDPANMAELKELYNKYSAWDWRYGQTPDFDISFNKRFDWGEIELGFKLKRAYIKKSIIYSDAMDADLIQEIAEALNDTPFKLDNIKENLRKIKTDVNGGKILKDIEEWLQTKLT